MTSNFKRVRSNRFYKPAELVQLLLSEHRPAAVLDAMWPSLAGRRRVEDLLYKRLEVPHALEDPSVSAGGPIGVLVASCIEAAHDRDLPRSCTVQVLRSPSRPKLGTKNSALQVDRPKEYATSGHSADALTTADRGHRHSNSRGLVSTGACCFAQCRTVQTQGACPRPLPTCNDSIRVAAQRGTCGRLRRILWEHRLPSDNYTVSPRIEE
jgi:hypothetical protein